MRLTQTSMDIELDETTGELSFGEGVLCDGASQKALGQMEGLYASLDGCDLRTRVYWAYRNIRRAEDEELWVPRGLRYDITVLMPGDANGEYFKTSGHYHGYSQRQPLPYPELYEVLCGSVAFVLQRSPWLAPDGGGVEPVDEVRIITAEEGEAIVIPPLWGHASVNTAQQVSAFSNIAVVDTPLLYGPVQERHGLARRVVGDDDFNTVEENDCWKSDPFSTFDCPVEAPEFGVVFGRPCYSAYVANPTRYAYLLDPEPYVAHMEELFGA